jgi:hypothetical protein
MTMILRWKSGKSVRHLQLLDTFHFSAKDEYHLRLQD